VAVAADVAAVVAAEAADDGDNRTIKEETL
jgi:hypothetical protein